MTADRRRHRRFVLQTPVGVTAGGQRSVGRLLDLSAGGAFITATVTAEVGDGAFIRFTHRQAVCEATGRVARTLPFGGENGVAFEFAFANDALLAFLRTLEATPDALRPDLLGDITEFEVQLA